MDSKKVLRFTAAERDNIRKQSVGKPTGVVFTIGDISLDLVPLTVQQAKDIFRIVDSLQSALSAATAGEGGATNFDASSIAAIVANDGPRATNLLYSILWRSGLATKIENGDALIEDSPIGKEIFDEWFDNLPVKETLVAFFPKLLEAQGLTSMLGNSSPPTQKPMATVAAGDSTP